MSKTSIKELDLLKCPINGTVLIDANAGTGKTYSISSLFVRLIVEKSVGADKILVVTFTEAATKELRDRIRRRIREALLVFRYGKSDDLFLRGLFESAKMKKTVDESTERLEHALNNFDEAPVFTIHGFCQRILSESAFEGGRDFEQELVTDEKPLVREIVDDFWRIYISEAPEAVARFLLHNKKQYSEGELFKFACNALPGPGIRLIPDTPPRNNAALSSAYDDYMADYCRLKNIWENDKGDVSRIILNGKLDGHKYGTTKVIDGGHTSRHDKIGKMCDAMEIFLSLGASSFTWLYDDQAKMLRLYTNESLGFRNGICERHEVFDICARLFEKGPSLLIEVEKFVYSLRRELLDYAAEQLKERKRERRILCFDDLVTGLAEALKNSETGSLQAETIRSKYSAALIDEFQDTDPVQYEIFKTVFGQAGGTLFIIGDPKQSIYSFRGADIFSYIEAKKSAGAGFTLLRNWRSVPGLIRAVNTIFEKNDLPFIHDGIDFIPSGPADEGERCLTIDGCSAAPLVIRYSADSHKNINKGAGTKLSAEITVSEIAGLIRKGRLGKAVLPDGKNVEAGNIAVLVRTNDQAVMIKERLTAEGIPAVLYRAGGVFGSREAEEMKTLLQAVADPGSDRALRKALVTGFFNIDAASLCEMYSLEEGLVGWHEKFEEYRDTWNRHGFFYMFRMLMGCESVRSVLLSFHDGDRRLTNVLHIAELLHQETERSGAGPAALIKWLDDRIEGRVKEEIDQDEHTLRLESDEAAVKILTVHGSKGLQYDVVFCPFLWTGLFTRRMRGGLSDNVSIKYHDQETGILICDVSPIDERKIQLPRHEKEELAEDLRLAYVALTRAKYRCCFVWGRFGKAAATSSLAYLLHRPERIETDDIAGFMISHVIELPPERIRERMDEIVNESGGSIEAIEIIRDQAEDVLDKYTPNTSGKVLPPDILCREYNAEYSPDMRGWRIHSFSSMISSREEISERESETPDRDAAAERPLPDMESQADGIFEFPAGARAGTMLHSIYEEIDFDDLSPAGVAMITGVVRRKLTEFGFDLKWEQIVVENTLNVLKTPLIPTGSEMMLSHVSKGNRLTELEFYFQSAKTDTKRIADIFNNFAGAGNAKDFSSYIADLKPSSFSGFMKGFVDLVFRYGSKYYIVDWKSNRLGKTLKAYNQAALEREMNHAFYTLQYHIYCVALNLYLKTRIKDYDYGRDFGGVFYIFLRGINPAEGGFGIYHDNPNEKLIHELSYVLRGI